MPPDFHASAQQPPSGSQPRLLFIPVSGAFGMGEFARCLNLALACRERWPQARIRFILSAQARYAQDLPFETVLLPSSPTFHTPQVVADIEQFAPTAVVFDNAGRTAQLAAARRCGAAVVYISARARQRRKAFRFSWLRLLDEHWIAWPRFMAGSLSWFERAKLRLVDGPAVRFLDCVLPALLPQHAAELLARVPAAAGSFVLVVPGGGTGHPRARAAVDAFRTAAVTLAGEGLPALFVAPGGSALAPLPGLTGLDLMPLAQLLTLLRHATVVLTNGGDTLIQAIALGVPAVSAPIAGDQPARIRAAVAAGVACASGVDAQQMAAAVRELWSDADARRQLQTAALRLELTDASSEAVQALATLMA